MECVIVTGMSGAGKTTALKIFESLGYYCVDNLPPTLMSEFVTTCLKQVPKIDKVALGIDIRGGSLFDGLFEGLDTLDWKGISYIIVFLDASDVSILNRYKETRQVHPLDDKGDLSGAIELEREKLLNIKQKSDHIINTSFLRTNELKEYLKSIFIKNEEFSGLVIQVLSFGFKNGLPVESDLVFDVRFLSNPFYEPELKPLTGLDKAVVDYVMGYEASTKFLKYLQALFNFLIPYYIKEGKNKLVVSIGCTGGRHRSVVLANALYESLKLDGHSVVVNHRDIVKDVQLGKIN